MSETNFENAILKLLIEDKDGIVTVASLQQTPSSGSGNVVGPASAIDGHLAVFDGATGELLKDGGAAGGSFLANQIARVDPTGNNSTGEVGNLAKPFLTVQGAIDAIEADGTLTYPIIDIGMNQYFSTTVTTSLPLIRFVGSSDEIGMSGFGLYYANVCRHLILTCADAASVELSGCELSTIAATGTAPHALSVFLENAGVTDSPAITAEGSIKIGGNGYTRARVTDVVTSNSGGTIGLRGVYVDDIDSAGSNVTADSFSLIRRISHGVNLTLKDSRALSKTITGTLTYDDTFLNGVVAVAVPAAANSTGITGQMAGDDTYLYRCTATNTWKRVAIATWP